MTSYKQLYRDAIEVERHNRLHPDAPPRQPYVTESLGTDAGAVIAVSDYTQALPSSIAAWVPGGLTVLGTDGFGRSDTRAALRDFFEVDARHIAVTTLAALARRGVVDAAQVQQAIRDLDIDPEKPNPVRC